MNPTPTHSLLRPIVSQLVSLTDSDWAFVEAAFIETHLPEPHPPANHEPGVGLKD